MWGEKSQKARKQEPEAWLEPGCSWWSLSAEGWVAAAGLCEADFPAEEPSAYLNAEVQAAPTPQRKSWSSCAVPFREGREPLFPRASVKYKGLGCVFLLFVLANFLLVYYRKKIKYPLIECCLYLLEGFCA